MSSPRARDSDGDDPRDGEPGLLTRLFRFILHPQKTNVDESLAIIRAVVAMAQSLDMTTTAEGVETDKEVELVRQLGCNKIQGFHFGRPMPAQEARNLTQRSPSPVAALA